MRAGIIVSTALHAGLIALAILGLGIGQPIEATPVESIAVDLVPMSDITNNRKGDEASTVVNTDTPSAVDAEKPPEIAQPTGNTTEDQPTPQDTPNPTPAPTVKTAPVPEAAEPDPAPEPVPEAAPEPAPRPAAAEPIPEPEPDPVVEADPVPTATPELVADAPVVDPADAAPKPIVKTAALDQKRALFKRQQDEAKAQAVTDAKKAAEAKAKADADAKDAAEAKKAEDAKKKADAKKAADKKKADEQKRSEQASVYAVQKQMEDILNDSAVNNEETRGATTGDGGEKTLGSTDGRAATLSRSEMDGLSAAMLKCFSPPPGATDEQASAVLEVRLSPSGMVVGQPRVLSVTGTATGQQTGSAAARAVLRCGQTGYTMLPQEKYAGDNGWNTVKVTFNARDAF